MNEGSFLAYLADRNDGPRLALLDSGASCHMFRNKELLKFYSRTKICKSTQRRSVPLRHLKYVLLVPSLSRNLISVPALCADGRTVKFDDKVNSIWRGSSLVARGQQGSSVYLLRLSAVLEQAHTSNTGKNAVMTLWHLRLGGLGANTRQGAKEAAAEREGRYFASLHILRQIPRTPRVGAQGSHDPPLQSQ